MSEEKINDKYYSVEPLGVNATKKVFFKHSKTLFESYHVDVNRLKVTKQFPGDIERNSDLTKGNQKPRMYKVYSEDIQTIVKEWGECCSTSRKRRRSSE